MHFGNGSLCSSGNKASQTAPPGSIVLDCAALSVAWLDRVTDSGESGNGSILASRRLPAVLAMKVAAPPPRTTEDQRRDSPVDSSHEDGQPKLGAPRIHGELLLLGFTISEPTVSRYLRRLKRHHDEGKAKRWAAFLNNHREVIAAFDFFTVPTLTFRVLYCLFVIEHGRRRIVHFNTTAHPSSEWIVQQLREAFPLPCPQRYVVLDRSLNCSIISAVLVPDS